MTAYQDLIPSAQQFYAGLAENNSKAWWDENRGPYDQVLRPGAMALLDDLMPEIADMADAVITPKVFRPHRDVRFSKDKTPYKTQLHMLWQIDCPGARQSPVFFFGIGLDYVTAGAGMMGFDKPMLTEWRRWVDLDTDRIMGIVDDCKAQGFALREPALKRVPPTFAKDHPAAELLRMKGLVASGFVPPGTKDLRADVLAAFAALWPVNALLIQIAEG